VPDATARAASPLGDLAAELDSAADGVFGGTLGADRSWLLGCAAAGTHLGVLAAALRASARLAREADAAAVVHGD
jgi:hypothetical protein